MNTVYFDFHCDEPTRRKRLYAGQLFVFSPRASTVALCEFAREMLETAFGSLDPRDAQHRMQVEDFASIIAPLKTKFIHDPKSLAIMQHIAADVGCDLEKTYIDVPRMRIATSHGYLTTGAAYAHHPHRDTWYSAPMAQLNWWMPIYPFESESSMAFHPRYWSNPVLNGSSNFNYYEWNAARKTAGQLVKSDTREQPKPLEEIELDPQVRIVVPVGGMIMFSAAQLHSTVPNTWGRTRYSIDFRTVNIDDVIAQGGAENVDSDPQGTSLRDFMRGTDLQRMPDEVIAKYDTTTPSEGDLIFQP
jgi:hypothetical protein